MTERFYHPGPLSPGPVSLEGQEAHHLAHVLRLKPGARVTLFNGDGAEYLASIEGVTKTRVELEITCRLEVSREADRLLFLACPLPKGDRAQFLIEKLTELGVRRYIPLRTRRSVVHPGEGKTEKLRRYVVEASKQSGRNALMEIEPAVEWGEFLIRAELPPLRLIAHPGGRPFAEAARSPGPCVIALGPEGGWTDEEVGHGIAHGWQSLALGRSILRIETAALAAAALALHAG